MTFFLESDIQSEENGAFLRRLLPFFLGDDDGTELFQLKVLWGKKLRKKGSGVF